MKQLYTRFLLLSIALIGAGQARAQQDCFSAIPVCNGTYTQNNSFVGTGTVPLELTTANQGCLLSGEKNDVWYRITVTTGGTFVFTITPNNPNDDYDFGVWDITGTDCSALYNYLTNTAQNFPPVRCNFAGNTPPGITGLTTTLPLPGQFDAAMTVTPGQVLLLNVSNFSSTQSGYVLNFTASTATFFDNTPPSFAAVNTYCQRNDSIVVTMSEPIQCSSLSANGSDFYVTGPGAVQPNGAQGFTCLSATAATTKIAVKFPTGGLPGGTYYLHAKNGTDGNSLQDFCVNGPNNQQSLQDSIAFTITSPTPATFTVDTPSCAASRLRFSHKVLCSSIAANGSDFSVSGPSPVTVVSASYNCSGGQADTISIKFAASITVPGTYTITPGTGTDNNGILDTCGYITNQPFSFVVSDRGLISATASPDVLCEPGYVQLASTPEFTLPPPLTTCGPHNGPLPTTAQLSVAVGTGTGTTTSPSPFYPTWHDARTQVLLRAADLTAAGLVKGTINSLALNVTTKNSTIPFNGFTIKIGCTSANDATSLNTTTTTTPVWGPTTYSSVAGVNAFPFTTAYDWDGSSNLLVEFCFDNTTWTGSPDALAVTPAGYQAMFQYFNDGVTGCTMTSSPYAPNVANTRYNITFGQRPVPISTYDQKWYPATFVGDSTAFNSLAYVPKTQTYTIQIKDTVGCYRRASATVTVSERNPYLLNNDTALCLGYSHQLMAGPAASYQWFPADGLSCTQCADPIATPLATTTYYVALFDQYGCSDTLKTTVTVNAPPVLRTSFEDSTIIWGQPVQLYVTAPGGKYYLWDPETDLNSATLPNPVARPEVSTTYRVMVIDTNNCYGYDSLRVRVRTDVPVFIPDAFTPNGDGRNDVFRVTKLSIQRVMEFRVFNRWGQQVFESNDGSAGWDGDFGGRPSEPGTYSYLVRVAWPDGKVERRTGTVLLIR